MHGPTIPPQLQRIHEISTDLLGSLHDFLVQHDIHYILIGGTLIGAIRHQGFIPWDDDLDIAIMRADYDRLLSMRDQLPFPLQASFFDNDPKHVYPFLRIHDVTTSVTIDYVKPVTRGVWVDILPIDGTFTNLRLRRWHVKSLLFVRSLITNITGGYIRKPLPKRLVWRYKGYSVLSRVVGKGNLIKLHHWLATLKSPLKSKTSGVIVGMAGFRETYETSVFQERELYPFHHLSCYGPRRYDEYLRKVYGDYMTPPPEAQRASVHPVGHIDFEKSFMETDPIPGQAVPSRHPDGTR